MPELPIVNLSSPPWQPTSSAHPTRIYHRHGIPLIGIVADQDHDYLFVRRYSGDETLSVWMYLNVSSNDVSQLDDASSSFEKFSILLNEFEDSRDVLYVLVHEDEGVVGTRAHSPGTPVRDDILRLIGDAKLPPDVTEAQETQELLAVLP